MPAPIASFSATTVCIGTPTQFTDSSYTTGGPPITGWSWTFGDGGTSPIQNPNHTYATAGSYTAGLTITAGACTSTYTLNVIVNTTVTPTFSAPPVCDGSPTVFTNTTTGASTYSWTFGDGNSSIIAAPSNTYSAAGTYVVTLSVTTASGCTGVGTNSVLVNPIPTLNPMSNIGVCDQQQVVVSPFVSVPVGATVGWSNNNTSIGLGANGAGNIATFTGASNGSATPVVAVVTAIPTLNGCVGPPITFNITISPQPTITIVSPAPYCPGDVVPSPVINSNPAGATYVWINNNTQIGLGGNGIGVPLQFNAMPNPNYTLNNVTGVITVTPAIGTCIGLPTTYTVTVKPTPVVNLIPNPDYCPSVNTNQINFTATPAGGTPTFFWSATNTGIGIPVNGTGSLGSFNTINVTTIDQSASVQVYATLNNCPGPITTFTITVDPNPVALFTASSKVCVGSPMSFIDQSMVGSGAVTQWGWDFNNDGIFTDALAQNPQYIFNPAGSYTVGLEVTTAKGCKNRVTEPVYVNYNPIPQFVGDVLTGCPIHPVNYTQSSIVTGPAQIISWAWNFGNGTTFTTQTAGINPGTIFYTNTSPTQSAYYTASLMVTTDSGCVGSLTQSNYITVYPHPIPNFSWGPTDPAPDIMDPMIYFTDLSQGASGPNNYGPTGMLWYLGDVFLMNPLDNYVNNIKNPSHLYDHDGPYTYYVTQWVQNIYGCKDSITKPVEIKPNWTFYIPNAFSPNGDGTNEGFKGTGIGIDNSTYNLWVFDRWGNMLFYSNDIDKSWDGRIQNKHGDIVQEDVYVWKARFSDFTGRKHEYKGTVSIIK
jgi:gliding motility-associated-like protein